ncbi:MAG: TetR/AcrR family transcriptional regulator [Deltaproteobacteria bacterium]|nr:TetR/AcrR family transcriptional regulator [Deltaproteobacteria bacterium]MBW2398621.1 TetR/AcrR family transcriptional regulator [Deltaproteobacteria bacterium]
MIEKGAAGTASGRERMLDAAESCLERFGLAKTTIEDVAQAAELSRATVYRQFGNRDGLLLGVAVRDAERTASEAELYLRRFDDVGSWIVEGMLFCLREIPKRPVLSQFLAPQEIGAASRLILTSERMFAIGAEILRPMFEPARREGLLQQDLDLDSLMEWVLRILMSYLAVPGPPSRTEEDLRRILRSLLLPAVLSK